ncbi:MurR/RpiR family transcriptional regulator [Cetobacterium sp.]|uniref:MurR/RpiR family transcriptional regulator n=1 Tax=Cetobacterium sp. TaxID=2071632 RepID=UPI002FC71969
MNEILNESLIEKLTENEKRVYSYVTENIKSIENLKIKEIAKNTFTSSATVVRTAKKLGFKGYKELIYKIVNKKTILECNVIGQRFNIKNEEQLNEMIELIDNGKIMLYAEGLASAIVLYIYEKLLLAGKNVELFNSPVCRLMLNNHDVEVDYDAIIIVSRLGKGDISLKIAEYLKGLGSKVVLFTSNKKSKLYDSADLIFEYKEHSDGSYENYYPTSFYGYTILFFEELFKLYFEKKYSFMKKKSELVQSLEK